MTVSKQYVKSLLEKIGFQGDGVLFEKTYPGFGCSIAVDFSENRITFPDELIVNDRTTSNLSKVENFVVLECVDRLLEKGYSPASIELEKTWALGRKNRGKLDILVKRKYSGSAYLMIECKTYGDEFQAEKKKMLNKNGGQLFSYWQQDRGADRLCLYSSKLNNGKIERVYQIVNIDDKIRTSKNAQDAYKKWNKQLCSTGLFEDDSTLYSSDYKPLKRRDLQPLGEKDGSRIYNQFLEILRHNIVSDKGNAFNKIFNLFLCKILDEDRPGDEELDFQWVENRDTPEMLLGRLNSLYKKGMLQYLNKEITDYDSDDIETDDKEIQRIVEELRLYKNQEFAFVEVFNKESFDENAGIVIEIVNLLQNWQIRYTHKQQFLSEFFELLLNTGFKQESGQFFTPVPLVQFILKCLPIDDIIHKKIKNREEDFLPYIIDFACGSGHFLTESMDMLLAKIKDVDIQTLSLSPKQKGKHAGYLADEFGWAKEYIYGIERDYRLAKTSKLASFLNGDGDANIAHASGIDPFSSDSYVGKLKGNGKHNEVFDILVSNPPYSVKSFKSTVKDGENSFNIFHELTDKSAEIETLFVERMAQLVAKNGVAGIVLPRSILTNSGIYESTRRIIIENFHLIGIVRLDGRAFSATTIKTIILFLKKRDKKQNIGTKADLLEICNNERDVIIVDSGEKDAEKKFLGYEFRHRKGNEGIRLINSEISINMTCEHIQKSMLDEKIPTITEELESNMRTLPFVNLFDLNGDFSNAIIIDRVQLEFPSSPEMLVPMMGCISTLESGSRPKGGVSQYTTGTKSLGGEHIAKQGGKMVFEKMKYVPDDFAQKMKSGHVKKEDILVCKDGALTGKTGYFYDDDVYCVNEHLFIVRADKKQAIQKYMLYFMMSSFFQNQVQSLAFERQAQPGLNKGHFEKIVFLKLSLDEQNKIVAKIEQKLGDTKQDRRIIDEVFKDAGLSFA